MSDYEITWDDSKIIPTLKQEICGKLGEKTWSLLIDGIDVPHHEAILFFEQCKQSARVKDLPGHRSSSLSACLRSKNLSTDISGQSANIPRNPTVQSFVCSATGSIVTEPSASRTRT
jgi:hypothetical protein